jgi:hypothetical protein
MKQTFKEWLNVREARGARLILNPAPQEDDSADKIKNFARIVNHLGWNHPVVKSTYRLQMDNPEIIKEFQRIIANAKKVQPTLISP